MEIRLRRIGGIAIAAAFGAATLAACAGGQAAGTGSSSASSARRLLHESRIGSRRLHSGAIVLRAKVTPAGSTALSGPLTVSLNGRFEQTNADRVPDTDFTIALSADSQQLSVGLITTADAAYVRYDGSWYRVPASQLARLRRSLPAAGATSALPKLGITPLHWLRDPQIVGEATVDGVATTEVSARVDVGALLADLQRLLSRHAALEHSKLGSAISPAQRRQLAAAVHDPTVELFVARGDHTLRRIALSLRVPVTGALASMSGVHSAAVAATLDYRPLRNPRPITAPSGAQPFGKLRGRLDRLGLGLGGAVSGSGSSTASTW